MAQPAGIDRDAVIEMASTMVDDEGVASLTLSALAKRLGIRTPSLYAHVEGFDGLIRDLALEGVRQLGEELRSSVLGRSGREALFAVANAYRRYATEHPGLYSLTVHDPGNDTDMRRANDRARRRFGLSWSRLEPSGLTTFTYTVLCGRRCTGLSPLRRLAL